MATSEPTDPTAAVPAEPVHVPPPPAPARGRRTGKATAPTAAAEPVAQPAGSEPPGPVRTTANGDGEGVTLHLPLVTATVRPPHLPRVGRRELAGAAGVLRSLLPPPEEALLFAGLGVLTLVELIEWPVAVAVAAGTVVAQRTAGRRADTRLFLPTPADPAAG